MEKTHGTLVSALALSVILILSLFPSLAHGSVGSQIGAAIDLYTEKTPFNGMGANKSSDAFEPQELVVLHALVTYNGYPMQAENVAFQVLGPPNPFQNITLIGSNQTDEVGMTTFSFRIPWPSENAEEIVFGEWTAIATVSIGGEVAMDTLTFQVGWIIRVIEITTLNSLLQPQSVFAPENPIVFNLTVENIALTPKNATITIDVQDSKQYPMIHIQMDDMLFQPGRSNVQPRSQIPIYSDSGLANVPVGNCTVYVSTYYSNTLVTNNATFTLTIVGDINGDGVVNIYDAILLASAFGSTPRDSNWNPNADLNNDGVVDIYDVILFSAHFGMSVP
jgi:hypothetical protein